MIKKLLLLTVILSSGIYAQNKIYFCSDYNSTGEPIGVSSVWNISAQGGNVFMLFSNDAKNITTPLIYIFIDKLDAAKEY